MIDKIRSLIVERYLTLFPDRKTVFENEDVSFDVEGVYNTFHFMPSEASPATLGKEGQDAVVGLFQVSVVYPLGVGVGALLKDVQKIKDAFNSSLPLQADSICVNISMVSYLPFQVMNSKYTTTISVYWTTREKRIKT